MKNLTPLYLRASDETVMISGLPAYMRSIDAAGNGIWAVAGLSPRFDLCVIGPVEADDRFHVNVLVDETALSDIPPELIIDPAPATPAVKFAGVE